MNAPTKYGIPVAVVLALTAVTPRVAWTQGAPAPAASSAASDTRVPCKVEPGNRGAALQRSFWAAIAKAIRSNSCDNVTTVLVRLLEESKDGGRELRPPPGLKIGPATQELMKARADPRFRAELQAEQADEVDPIRLRIIEAALLDANNFFAARDLLIYELRKEGLQTK